MPSSDPSLSPTGFVSELLKQAAATPYCRPALRDLATRLPADDGILARALNQAAAGRDAKGFSHLYLAALYGGRKIAAEVLELGAALLPEAMLLLHTALRLEGDVAKALAVAVRAGRMGGERDAIALIAGWLDYERRKAAAPPEFLATTRKVCREAVRLERFFVKLLLNLVATLSGDPVVAHILNAAALEDPSETYRTLELARKFATEPGWDGAIPDSPVAQTMPLGGGATLKRAIPKAGRNDPCPCGSGKKFKRNRGCHRSSLVRGSPPCHRYRKGPGGNHLAGKPTRYRNPSPQDPDRGDAGNAQGARASRRKNQRHHPEGNILRPRPDRSPGTG